MPRKPAIDALTLFDSLVYTCQYRVSIDVPSEALAWVMQCRHALRDRIGRFECFYRLPGITLLETELPPEYESALRDAVERGSKGLGGFKLRLNGILHTDDRKRIYVGAEPMGGLASLQQRLVDHVRANKRIRKLGVEAPQPMLLIAGPLKAAQFEQAWEMLAKETYAGERSVSDLTLMKREVADDSLDEHVRSFKLETLV
ncbi:MAG TPA: 2'-5' RNA ligase family protein [Flavobacteriales bacterium]|nr:2'-5' RNA ligase family protein [Flavobacteriales bacterium]